MFLAISVSNTCHVKLNRSQVNNNIRVTQRLHKKITQFDIWHSLNVNIVMWAFSLSLRSPSSTTNTNPSVIFLLTYFASITLWINFRQYYGNLGYCKAIQIKVPFSNLNLFQSLFFHSSNILKCRVIFSAHCKRPLSNTNLWNSKIIYELSCFTHLLSFSTKT